MVLFVKKDKFVTFGKATYYNEKCLDRYPNSWEYKKIWVKRNHKELYNYTYNCLFLQMFISQNKHLEAKSENMQNSINQVLKYSCKDIYII